MNPLAVIAQHKETLQVIDYSEEPNATAACRVAEHMVKRYPEADIIIKRKTPVEREAGIVSKMVNS